MCDHCNLYQFRLLLYIYLAWGALWSEILRKIVEKRWSKVVIRLTGHQRPKGHLTDIYEKPEIRRGFVVVHENEHISASLMPAGTGQRGTCSF